MAEPTLRGHTIGGLLSLYGEILAELKRRGATRSLNAPAGDLAETLAKLVYGGSLGPPSVKSWDLELEGGRKLQVKCRVRDSSQRGGFSPIRSDGFDLCVFVILDPNYSVVSAVEVPKASVFGGRPIPPKGRRIGVTRDLMKFDGSRDRTGDFVRAMHDLAASIEVPQARV